VILSYKYGRLPIGYRAGKTALTYFCRIRYAESLWKTTREDAIKTNGSASPQEKIMAEKGKELAKANVQFLAQNKTKRV